MPTYDYECKKCKAQFQINMTIREKETKKITCPKCKSPDTYQLFNKITSVDDMSTGEDFSPPQMPPGGMGMPGMGGMGMPGCDGGMCGPGMGF